MAAAKLQSSLPFWLGTLGGAGGGGYLGYKGLQKLFGEKYLEDVFGEEEEEPNMKKKSSHKGFKYGFNAYFKKMGKKK